MLILASTQFFFRHPGQLLLALVGVAAGTAVMVGVALLRDVLLDALDAAATELAGPDSLVIRDAGGMLDESVYAMLARRPGAPELTPILRIPVRRDGQRLEVLATDPFSLGPGSRLGLSGPMIGELLFKPVALTSRNTLERLGLRDDAEIRVTTGQAVHRLTLTQPVDNAPGLDDRLLMDIAQAQAVFGRQGRLTELLAPAAARQWLSEHLPEGLEIVDRQARRDSARRLTAGMRANLGAMSLLALATGLFVVFSVLSFLMVQRRRSFGILRAVGVTRGRLAGMLAGEAATLGALGGLTGLVAGTWLAGRLLELVRGPVAEIYRQIPAAGVQPTAGLYALVWSVGILAALAVVVPVVREAIKLPPGRLVRQWRPPPWPLRRYLLAGGLPVLGGLVWILVDSRLGSGLAGMFLILAGLVVLVPEAGFRLLGTVGRALPDGLTRRALILLQSARSRLAPALAALTLAVALAAGMGMMILGFRGAVDDWVDRLLRAEVYVSGSAAALAPEFVERVRSLPGVDAVSSVRTTQLADGLRISAYDLPDPAWAGFELLSGDPAAARVAFVGGTGALVSEPLARRLGLSVGDRLDIPTPSDGLELQVAAVFRDYSTDRGFVALDGALYRRHFDDTLRDSLGIYPSGEFDLAEIEQGIAGLAPADLVLTFTRPRDIRSQTLQVFDRTFRISWALAGLVGLIALVALTSSLMALGLERGRDYATLRALGLSPAELVRLVTLQTGAVAAVAGLLAAPLAVVIHLTLSGVIQPRAFGWTVPLGMPPAAPLLSCVLVVAAGALAGLYPAWKIARVSPAVRLRTE